MSSIEEVRERFSAWTDDSRFAFDEPSHTYTHGKRRLSSVSSFIARFYEEFDTDVIAERTAIKRGVSKTELLQEWKETNEVACDLGHDVHYYIECDMTGQPLPTFGEQQRNDRIKAYLDLKEDHLKDLEVVFAELRVFDLELGLAGTVDGLYWDGEAVRMYDWKTNKKMTHDDDPNGRWKKMYWPWDDQWDNKLNHYSIQLSMYRYILKRGGIDVPVSRLYHFPPEGGYVQYDCKDYTERIEEYFKHFKPLPR